MNSRANAVVAALAQATVPGKDGQIVYRQSHRR